MWEEGRWKGIAELCVCVFVCGERAFVNGIGIYISVAFWFGGEKRKFVEELLYRDLCICYNL